MADQKQYEFLQEEVRRLDRYMEDMKQRVSSSASDIQHMMLSLLNMLDILRRQVERLSPDDRWERERDCYDVNSEYEQP